MRRNIIQPTAQHEKFMQELNSALSNNKDMDATEILAIVSQFIGKLIVLQDSTRTPAAVMKLVARNIEIGNKAAADFVKQQLGGLN